MSTKKEEPVAEPAKKNIHQRMLAAMLECGYVQKDGYNSFSKYKYVTHDAVTEHARPALLNNGVLPITTVAAVEWPEGAETQKGKTNNICRVKLVTRFINADDPADFIEVEFWGEASDTGDKSIFKAISGAKKYIFTNTLMLATGDDPEQESPTYRQPHGGTEPKSAPKAENIKKPTLDAARAAYTDCMKSIGLTADQMGSAFKEQVPEGERQNPEFIQRFIYSMEKRHSAWMEVLDAIEKWAITGEQFSSSVAEIVGGEGDVHAGNWFLHQAATLDKIADNLNERYDLPFDGEGKAIPK